MTGLVLLLAAGLAAPANAAVAAFRVSGKTGSCHPYAVSADGYHFAAACGNKLIKDGKPILVEGPDVLAAGLAMSRDGSVLIHTISALDENGRRVGVSVGINGRRVGAAFDEIDELRVSPSGANFAVYAKSPKGRVIASAAGVGPAFEGRPFRLALGDGGLLYLSEWQGRKYLYRDHAPVGEAAYSAFGADPGLRRLGTATRGPQGIRIDVDGKKVGDYPDAEEPSFSEDGAHWAFRARAKDPRSDYDLIVVDGTAYPASPRPETEPVLRPGAAEAWWYGQRGSNYLVHRNGQLVGTFPGTAAGGRRWISFSKSGRRWALAGYNGGRYHVAVDGEIVDDDAKVALEAPVFDSDTELHYVARGVDDAFWLVCVTLDQRSPKQGRCAQTVRTLYRTAGEDAAE